MDIPSSLRALARATTKSEMDEILDSPENSSLESRLEKLSKMLSKENLSGSDITFAALAARNMEALSSRTKGELSDLLRFLDPEKKEMIEKALATIEEGEKRTFTFAVATNADGLSTRVLQTLVEELKKVRDEDRREFANEWRDQYKSGWLRDTTPNKSDIYRAVHLKRALRFAAQLEDVDGATRQKLAELFAPVHPENLVAAVKKFQDLPKEALIELAKCLVETTEDPQTFAEEWVKQYHQMNSGWMRFVKIHYPTVATVTAGVENRGNEIFS